MKFSIVIPSFNSTHTIAKCLESVLCQSDFDLPIEIVLVDDASTDDTVDIAKSKLESAPPNVSFKILVNESNSGASVTRNRGITSASGEYILFLDSDDYYHEHKLKILSSSLNSSIKFLFHDFTYSFNDTPFSVDAAQGPERLPNRFKYFNLVKNRICTPCVIVHRSVVQNFDISLKRMEDLELWTRIMASGTEAHHLSYPLVELGHELNKGTGLSSNNAAMRTSEREMLKILAQRFTRIRLLYPAYLLMHYMKIARDKLRTV
ncbi:glycosyltransferase family 2 protein [Vibrio maritimus]|uniref:glycosyltransferase family 2 protein n=1 Tax=Vibrio maritimus TaxID=990268 RepID=UPI0037357DD1